MWLNSDCPSVSSCKKMPFIVLLVLCVIFSIAVATFIVVKEQGGNEAIATTSNTVGGVANKPIQQHQPVVASSSTSNSVEQNGVVKGETQQQGPRPPVTNLTQIRPPVNANVQTTTTTDRQNVVGEGSDHAVLPAPRRRGKPVWFVTTILKTYRRGFALSTGKSLREGHD